MLSETKVTFFGILVLAISGASCSSNEQKERLQNVSQYFLDDTKNRFEPRHLACFRCETGKEPRYVAEIVNLRPTSQPCKAHFEQPIDFFNPEMAEFVVTVEQLDDRQIYVFSRSGVCLLYTSPSPRDGLLSRMPSSA